MTIENIIASCIFITVIAAIVGLTVYKMKKQYKDFTIEQFIDYYYDNIINALQSVVLLLQINIDEFEDKESYDKVIIATTLTKLKENASEFGIDTKLLNILNIDTLTEAIYGLFCEEEATVFSVIGSEKMNASPALYSTSTIGKVEYEEKCIEE